MCGPYKSLHAQKSLNSAVLISMKPLSGWSGPAVSLKPKPDQKGRAGQGRAEQGRAGQGRVGHGRVAGQGRAGQGRAGQARAGQGEGKGKGKGRAGQGRAGPGRAGQGRGRAGQGRAGQGRAGQGRAGQTRAAGQGTRPRPGPGQARGGGTRACKVRGLGSYSSDWLACLSHAPAPEPVLGLLRCACRASSSLTDASARSLLLLAVPAARFSLGLRVGFWA